MKKIFSLMLVVVVMMSLAVVPAQAAGKSFSDVPSNYWAAPAIQRATELGIMSGYSDGKFYPENTLTRAEVAQILYNMSPEFKNGDTSFRLPRAVRDVERNSWYYTAIAWLYDQMLDNDYYGFRDPYRPNDLNNMSYRPNEGARRDFVVNMIRCMAGNYGYYFYSDKSAQKFKDYDEMDNFTRYSVAFAVDRGLVNGYPDGRFGLASTITRAEAAQIFLAYYDNLMGQVYPNKIDGDYLYINNQTIDLYKSKRPMPATNLRVSLYDGCFVYGENTENVLSCLYDLPEQIVFTIQVDGATQNYYVARKVCFASSDLFMSSGNPTRTCRNIFEAYYGKQYDLAIMNDAYVVIFAYKCY